ncbi:putative PurR-regulated permease PerM [Pelomonas aquatica]|uniref:PurR-regulated permease PerM n=1 Tax=Pelomonas aquatica TaxID=431058 RepID=A0ABU1Z428_9BURK|nr:AI-2E family transporter [Pelomonas aquatica]MDR7295368.1 putative PurR-regulated permease PerM [Pelomonas aquatica]
MNFKSFVTSPRLEHNAFLALLVAVTLAFVWILQPFGGAVFWGAVIAIVFAPIQMRLLRRWPRRPTLAALATLSLVVLLVVLPLTLLTGMLVKEGAALYQRVQSGETNFVRYFEQVVSVLPAWLHDLLEHFGLTDLKELQARITDAVGRGSQMIATYVYSVGQNALDVVVGFFVMLYLAFFLLRDGASLTRRIRAAVPLEPEHRRQLAEKFITVIRATVKGNILVAAAQGALGGLAFWFFGIQGALLWAVLMGFLSLLPAIGAALIWLPVALYFLVTGAIWQGVTLILYGVLVIGLVDNVLRPILVGKDTQMPDYLVLISTIGGMAIFGINGFVIGPVIAAMFMAVWDLFGTAREAAAAEPPVDDARP